MQCVRSINNKVTSILRRREVNSFGVLETRTRNSSIDYQSLFKLAFLPDADSIVKPVLHEPCAEQAANERHPGLLRTESRIRVGLCQPEIRHPTLLLVFGQHKTGNVMRRGGRGLTQEAAQRSRLEPRIRQGQQVHLHGGEVAPFPRVVLTALELNKKLPGRS